MEIFQQELALRLQLDNDPREVSHWFGSFLPARILAEGPAYR